MYLPGLPNPVTLEEWLDPGDVEVDLESVTCQALLAEWLPRGVPPELRWVCRKVQIQHNTLSRSSMQSSMWGCCKGKLRDFLKQ